MLLAHGGMELSWLYAWATFLMTSLVHRPFPLPERDRYVSSGGGAYPGDQGNGSAVGHPVGAPAPGVPARCLEDGLQLQLPGISLFRPRVAGGVLWPSEGSAGVVDTRSHPALCGLFWLAGVTLARRSTTYLALCGRFDLGVTAFFCLFLVKLLLLVKAGVEVHDPAPELLLFPFLSVQPFGHRPGQKQQQCAEGIPRGLPGSGGARRFQRAGPCLWGRSGLALPALT